LSEAPQPAVRLSGVSRRFRTVEAIRPLDLEIARGEFLAILGPSGCGKTTLLRMIGGFVQPSSGRVEVDGRDVTRLPPERRPTNMVFQGYGLFPHMTVRQNVAYGLKLRRLKAEAIEERVEAMLRLVRLEELAERGMGELSGGQQQRVALARALVLEPKVLLLDEPLAALDLKLRQAMQDELRRIHRAIGGTFVFVTHDQGEALALASRIAVMNAGRLEQVGTPEEIYQRPASRFVATFIGEANLLAGTRRGGVVALKAGPRFAAEGADGPLLAVARPEALSVLADDALAEVTLAGKVEEVVFLGSHLRYLLALASGERLQAQDRAEAPRRTVGEMLTVGCAAADLRVIAE
jgi:ABC-type Fe3+/spermidine/putrescine transport system ATPase subunit